MQIQPCSPVAVCASSKRPNNAPHHNRTSMITGSPIGPGIKFSPDGRALGVGFLVSHRLLTYPTTPLTESPHKNASSESKTFQKLWWPACRRHRRQFPRGISTKYISPEGCGCRCVCFCSLADMTLWKIFFFPPLKPFVKTGRKVEGRRHPNRQRALLLWMTNRKGVKTTV